jgi:hypothetical protein
MGLVVVESAAVYRDIDLLVIEKDFVGVIRLEDLNELGNWKRSDVRKVFVFPLEAIVTDVVVAVCVGVAADVVTPSNCLRDLTQIADKLC